MIEAIEHAGIYALRISGIIAASFFLAEFLSRMGLFGKFSFLARPLSKLSHLGPQSCAALLTSFLSPTSASAMLRDFYERGEITRRELFLASLSRALPTIFMESRYMLPLLIPVLGLVGLLYYLIWVGINSAVTLSSLLLGRVLLPRLELEKVEVEARKLPLKEVVKESLKGFIKPLFKALRLFVPAVFAAFILSELGFFHLLASKLSFLSHLLPFPPQGLALVSTYMASPVAAYPLAARLIAEGILLPNEVILCFLSGYLVALPLHLRMLLPHYIGIYGLRNGLGLMAASFASRSAFVLVAIGLLRF